MKEKFTAAGTAAVRAWRVWIGLLALIALVLWTAGACAEKIEPGKVEVEPGVPLPDDAVVETVERITVSPRIDVVGTVQSEETIHLSPRLSAYVAGLHVSAGDAVQANQVLVELDAREIREQLAAAEARLKQADTEFQRTRHLVSTQAATKQALDAAESAFDAAKAHVEQIKVMLTYTRITSPIDGVVTDRRIEVGDLANPGQVLLSVYDPDNMRLEAAVPVRLIDRLRKGQKVHVAVDAPIGTLEGTVTEIVSEVDPATRTRKARIHLETGDGELLPGTFGRTWVTETPYEAITVPPDAVTRIGQLDMVHLAAGDRLVRRLVKTGPRHGDRVEILSGLKPGDALVLNPRGEE